MIERMKAWWRLRSRREQRLLAVMAALAAVLLLWLGIVRPMDDALATARRGHADAVIATARAEAKADAIRRIERSVPRRTSQPVAARVAALAAAAGLDPARTTREGTGVALGFDAVRPPALFGFVDRLEREEGLVVDRFAARANLDRTLSVDLTVRARR